MAQSTARPAAGIPLSAVVEVAPALTLAAGALATGLATGWHVSLNDFWGNVILAEQANLRQPSTWYSGFFPFGYHLLLRLAGADTPVLFGYALNVVAGAAAVWVVTRTAARWVTLWLALGIGWALALWPAYFQYTTTPGPDLLGTAFAASGVAMLTTMLQGSRRWPLAFAGILLGLSVLCRHHFALIAFGAIVTWAILVDSSKRSSFLLIGPVVAVIAQAAVNLSAGRGAFETTQALNVQRALFGIDWGTLNAATPVPRLFDVVASDPSRFVRTYARALVALFPYAVPAVLGVLITRRGSDLGRAARLLVYVMIVYVLSVSAAASSRASLPLLPLAALSAAVVAGELASRGTVPFAKISGSARAAPTAIVVLVLLGHLARHFVMDVRLVERRMDAHRELTGIEAALRDADITSAKQVFTTDLSLYLPQLPPHMPYSNGGWYRLDSPMYDRRYPALCLESPVCLVADGRAHGVKAIVIQSTPANRALLTKEWPKDVVRIGTPRGWFIVRIP